MASHVPTASDTPVDHHEEGHSTQANGRSARERHTNGGGSAEAAPSAAASQVGNLFVGAALVEALGILAFVLGILAWLG